jgi:hypothetical protein
MHDLHREVPSLAIVFFVLGTFAITWGILGSYILFPEATVSLFEEISGGHPLFFGCSSKSHRPFTPPGMRATAAFFVADLI